MRIPAAAAGRGAAFALALGMLPVTGAAAGIDARVVGDPRSSVLQVSVELPRAFAREDGAWELRLPERYALQSATDVVGRPLDMQREAERIVVRPVGGTAPEAMLLHYHWPLSRPLEETRLTVGLGWLPVPASARGDVVVTLRVSLPTGLVAVSTGEGRREPDGGTASFVWKDALTSGTPLVVGRLGWSERRASGRVLRVALPSDRERRADEILDLLERAAGTLQARLGSTPGRDFTLALLPLPQGRRGLSLPGLALADADGVPADGPLPERELAGLLERDWQPPTDDEESP